MSGELLGGNQMEGNAIDKMGYLISIIVPVYNVEEYVRECIESILAQTYQNLEIILVDDGSTDRSGAICDEYAEKDCRINVIHQKNGGVTSARKAGVAIATGQYIGFVDADDWIESPMYEHMLSIILKTSADFVDSGPVQENGFARFPIPIRGNCNDIYITEHIREHIIMQYILDGCYAQKNILPCYWAKLFQADVIKKNILFISEEIEFTEDLINIAYIIYNSKKISFTDQYYYHYRYRKASASNHSNSYKFILQCIESLKGFYKFLKHCGYDQQYRNAVNYRIFSLLGSRAAYKWITSEEVDIYKEKSALYMYPDEAILKNKKIVLYGAGEYGKHYYKRYSRPDLCQLVCWSDKEYKSMIDYPCRIESPDNILSYDFDYLLIAVFTSEVADRIKRDLIKKGILENKILWQQPKLDLDWLL